MPNTFSKPFKQLNKRYGPNSFALKTTLSMSDLRSRLFTWVPVSPGVPTAPVVPVAPAVPTAPVVPVDPVDDNDKPLCFCKKVWIDDGRKMVECSNELCEFNRWIVLIYQVDGKHLMSGGVLAVKRIKTDI